jgi:hypothetical protein
LDSLTPTETAAYIRHRLAVVGGAPELFDDKACACVHYFTGGIPRLINLLCDQAMVYGFSEDRLLIKSETIAEVVSDRAGMGLSPFRKLPEGWRLENLNVDIADLLAEIEKTKTAAPVTET